MNGLAASAVEAIARADAWFASLPQELADRLLAEGSQTRLSSGQRLFARGDPTDGLYCVVRGVMRITHVTPSGRESLLAMLEPPQWFGEIALFDGQPRTHDAWAQVDCVLFHVPQKRLQRMLDETPQWWREFGRLLTQKLRVTFAGLASHLLLPPVPRVAQQLATMAGGYGSWKQQRKRELDVSQEQFGLMLALSRQTINHALKELELRGLVRRNRGSVELLDLDGLQNFSPIDR